MDLSFIKSLIDPETIIQTVGIIGVIAIIFLETGAFFGFFFPGDSLLFTAGFFASQGYISFPVLLIGTFLAAVIGDSVGYAFGKKVGPSIFTKEDSIFFNKKHIIRAQRFYEEYGKKTIVLARFVPIVRTFAPIVAGIGNMKYSTFISFNIIGGFLWTWAMLWMGFGLGSLIPDPDKYVLPIIAVIIIVSVIPVIRELIKGRRASIN
ncbi:MAG: DedA family protein [Candidatus Paceibacterota bacterium]|jgi:membrane-associated protein